MALDRSEGANLWNPLALTVIGGMLVATPLSHAAAAVFVPTMLKGGTLYAMAGFSPDEFFGIDDFHNGIKTAAHFLHLLAQAS